MSRESVQFSQMVREAGAQPAGPDDGNSFLDYCVHCRRETAWEFVAHVAGQQAYQCSRCGCQGLYTVPQ